MALLSGDSREYQHVCGNCRGAQVDFVSLIWESWDKRKPLVQRISTGTAGGCCPLGAPLAWVVVAPNLF